MNEQPEPQGSVLDLVGSLGATVIRGDGTHHDCGILSQGEQHRLIGRPVQWWRSAWRLARKYGIIPLSMGFAAFLQQYGLVDDHLNGMGSLFKDQRFVDLIMRSGAIGLQLVVTGGVNFLATDMATGHASPYISSMNYHDSGTGTVAATSTESALGTQAGPSTRATGTQTNPATNQYKSVGTISYTTGLTITEWGLFNQSAQGAGSVLWDRRVFTGIAVVNTDQIQFSYTLTLNAGGS